MRLPGFEPWLGKVFTGIYICMQDCKHARTYVRVHSYIHSLHYFTLICHLSYMQGLEPERPKLSPGFGCV